MFIDEVSMEVHAGNGGDGCLAFRREKFLPMGGPFGGNGGRGSNIIFKVDTGLHTLLDLRYHRIIKGKKGENGEGKNQNGKNSEDVIIRVPQGTVITDLDSGLIVADLKEKDAEVIVEDVVDVEIRLLKHKVIPLRTFRKRENRERSNI